MKEKPLHLKWLDRAKSNLERARSGKTSRYVLYEDICFDCQQTVEKSLKAMFVFKNISFEWTHNIGVLLNLLEENGIKVPEKIKVSAALSIYAVRTRYPGEEKPVSKSDYVEAFSLAGTVYRWIKAQIKK